MKKLYLLSLVTLITACNLRPASQEASHGLIQDNTPTAELTQEERDRLGLEIIKNINDWGNWIFSNNREILLYIQNCIDYGANINIQDRDGNTPLHMAILNNNANIVQLLLDHNANITISNNKNCTPLHTAASYAEYQHRTSLNEAESYRNNEQIILLLLDHGANINIQDNNGNAPLHMAIFHNEHIIPLLLDHGANINIQDNNGRTILFIAVTKEKERLVELLLSYNNIDITLKNKANFTPLNKAFQSNMWKIAKLILTYGAYTRIYPQEDVKTYLDNNLELAALGGIENYEPMPIPLLKMDFKD